MKTQSEALRDLLRQAHRATDEYLMMSRMDTHASRVSSIVLGPTYGGRGLRRVFLAWPGHQLAENVLTGKLPVGIHDHRYSLQLTLIAGKVRNTLYGRATDKGRPLREFLFQSGEMKGPPKVTGVRVTNVAELSTSWLQLDRPVWMAAEAVHNVDVPGLEGPPAAWLVEEGPVERGVTTLFSPNLTIDTEGLYQPFQSAEDVLEHVGDFIKLFS